MTQFPARRDLVVVGMVLVLVSSAIALVPLAAASGHTPPASGETFDAATNVQVWERSIVTLRADTGDAATTIDNADWRIRNQGSDETSLNRDPIPVYEANTQITFEFDEANADKGGLFGNTQFEVIRAHVDESGGSVPSSFSDATDLLNQDTANENATFEDLGTHTASGGVFTFSDEPAETGHYVYFVANNDSGNGFEVSGGDISVESETTVVGVEHVAVRSGTGSVDAPDEVTRGETASFDVDAGGLGGAPIEQTVLLYDEGTYVGQSVVVAVQSDIDSNFDPADDTRLETTISEVNGVANVSDSFSMFGVTVGDGQIARSAGVGSLVDVLGDQLGEDTPDVDTGDVVLNGSMTAISRNDADQTIEVATVDNWTTGTYRWVYAAAGDSSQDFYLQTGTLQVDESDGGGGGGGGGGGSSGGGSSGGGSSGSGDGGEGDVGPPDEPGVGPDCGESQVPSVSVAGNRASVSVPCVAANDPVSIPLGLNATRDGRTVAFERVNVTPAADAANVSFSVTTEASPPGEMNLLPDPARSMGYVTVTPENLPEAASTPGTFTFRLPSATLESLDVPPTEVRLYRHVDGSWETLETTHLGGERFQATTPGFSTFAVGTTYASIDITDASVEPAEVGVGNASEVTIGLENAGNREGSVRLDVTANDEQRTSANVSVGAEESTTAAFSLVFDEPGTYDVTVNGVSAGTVTVSDGGDEGALPEIGGSTDGFLGIVVLLVLGIVVAVFFLRRWRT